MRYAQRDSVSVIRGPFLRGHWRRTIEAVAAIFRRRSRRRGPSMRDLHHLSEHIRRDIGISP